MLLGFTRVSQSLRPDEEVGAGAADEPALIERRLLMRPEVDVAMVQNIDALSDPSEDLQ